MRNRSAHLTPTENFYSVNAFLRDKSHSAMLLSSLAVTVLTKRVQPPRSPMPAQTVDATLFKSVDPPMESEQDVSLVRHLFDLTRTAFSLHLLLDRI